MKKKLIIAAAVTVFALPCVVYAASQGYVSYITLPADQQLQGSTRAYTYDNHKVTITPNSIYDAALAKKLVISLNKKNLIGSTQQARKVSSFTVGTTFTTIMGNYGSGNKWYGFGTYENALKDGSSGHGAAYSGIDSDNVAMTSYN